MDKKRDNIFTMKKRENPDKEKKDRKDVKDKQTSDVKLKKNRKEVFDKNRGIGKEENGKSNGDKKPFDKKAYRLKKYSKKYKLDQWEEQRKKKLLREYHKEIKNDAVAGSYKPRSFDKDETDEAAVGRFVRHPDLIVEEKVEKPKFIKKDTLHKAKEHLDKVKEEKLQKQQEIEKSKEEKRQKVQEYKKKKQERFKKLSKKTRKGQPVMTGRLELLLEKIQSNF